MPTPLCAVQVTSVTISSTGPSSVWIGVAGLAVLAVNVQPGNGSSDTEASGASAGIFTVNPTVVALASSFGTLNVSVA